MGDSSPEKTFTRAVRDAAQRALGITPESVPLTYPPGPELGDLATPVCFELARVARKAPREIAKAIVEGFEAGGLIERAEVAGGGYINVFFQRDELLRQAIRSPDAGPPGTGAESKVIVEHTNINPNKAAHIGHLRNAVLGDTLVRFLRALGRPVEVQNYIDDTGVQVADLVVGFEVLREEGLDRLQSTYSDEELAGRGQRFDYVAWDLYAEVTRVYGERPETLEHRERTLHAMEAGDNPTARLAAHVAQRMVSHHLETMQRIGVRYDVLPHESDILRLHFWETAFARFRDAGAIRKLDEGKNAGCWVMDLEGVGEGAGEDQKVIVRSNGTVTYVGKDMAYQLWKLGLLGRDFHYRPFDWAARHPHYPVWTTCSEDGSESHPDFGGGQTVYNVIDTRQSYLQRVVAQGLRSLGFDEQADRSIHYSYEMVALTPASVEALFPEFPLSEEDRGKAYIEMSGRRGLGVRADDLLDALERRASQEIARRHEQLEQEEVVRLARQISVGALRYYMLRFTRNRVVAFDLDAALAFEGETGPYLQYSVVRAKNILGKVREQLGDAEVDPAALADALDLQALAPDTVAERWKLVLLLLRVDAMLRQAVDSLELSLVAKHAYQVAQAFNSFYHRFRVAQESDAAVRRTRIAIVHLYRERMVTLLDHMGIEVPDRM